MVTVTVQGTPSSEILDIPDIANKIFVSNAAFENFQKICRFCLGFDNLKPVFGMTYKQASVQGIIFECSSLKVNPEDHLPYNLCLTCIAELIRCYKFKKRCILATNILQNVYNNRNCRETKETATQYHKSERYSRNHDNLVIGNEEICNGDISEYICSDILSNIVPEYSRNTVNSLDESYRFGQSKIAETTNIVQGRNIKTEETAMESNNSECYGGSRDNLIIKIEEIGEAPTICTSDSENKTENNIGNGLDSIESCKITGITNVIQDPCNSRYIKVEETAIQSNNLGCYDVNQDNLIFIKREEIADVPMVCSNISEGTCHDTVSGTNYLNSIRTETPETAFTEKKSELALQNFQGYFENKPMSVNTKEKQPFGCSICEKSFAKKITLGRHMLSHTGERPHECSVCKESFIHKHNLKQHMLIHAGERPHECSICKKSFIYRSNLNQHMLIHAAEKPYKCTVCEESFVYRHNLKQHMLIHTGERPHKCTVCKKSYNRKGYLDQHMLIHTGEKTHECSVCKKTFIHSSQFKQHMLIHTDERPHKCSVCGKSYDRRGYLDQHMVIHAGEKPHECSICKKTFTRRTNLTAHIRLHTGEKPFDCSVCNRSFTNKRKLKKHMSLHTDDSVVFVKCENKVQFIELL